ncbi:hypothetical protein F5890DRAFT_1559820 [Lentinula detonsa]|uniref:Zn(2)-C6 fungal-type domain-containing protein n=1 Tax=Lentinula detonsa TaxID=2804962 RepID=A0AA38PNN2_9AGAR|nr:hypothetical protein F5890DRAFT_1559820 [Lentinula detonsa]
MSPANSRANSLSDDKEQAELLLIQKKKEERAIRDAERKAEEEAEAAAEEARLAEIQEMERHRKEEESKAAEAAKKAAEEARKENERKKAEEESKAAEAAKRAVEENRKKIEMERRMETAALVRAQIEKKKKEQQLNSPVSETSTVVVGQKWKRVAVVVPSGDPEGGDPNPGDDDDYIESDTDDDEDPEVPPTSPPKQSRCSRCILKAFKCELVGPGSASCKGCRKAKVRCSLVPDDYPRRSKRVKVESPVASTSSQVIDDLRTNVRDLNTRINLQEEMLRYLILHVRKLEEANREEDEDEESEEDRVKRTGDRKGKGWKE